MGTANQVFKVGDVAFVVDNINQHKFQLGTEVTVLRVKENRGAYKCSDGNDVWWLESKELEKG